MISVYIFSFVFGGAVLLIDLLGLLGSNEGDSDDASDDLDAVDQGTVMPDSRNNRWVYKLLNMFRRSVYFCCGFGAVGIFGTMTNRSFLITFLFSTGSGIVILLMVKLASSIQSKTLDSQLKQGELLFSEGEVIVSINPGKTGKVRVSSGGRYYDLYATGKNPEKKYEVGTTIFVVDSSRNELVVATDKTGESDF